MGPRRLHGSDGRLRPAGGPGRDSAGARSARAAGNRWRAAGDSDGAPESPAAGTQQAGPGWVPAAAGTVGPPTARRPGPAAPAGPPSGVPRALAPASVSDPGPVPAPGGGR